MQNIQIPIRSDVTWVDVLALVDEFIVLNKKKAGSLGFSEDFYYEM